MFVQTLLAQPSVRELADASTFNPRSEIFKEANHAN